MSGKTIVQKIFSTHMMEGTSPDMCVISLDQVFCHEITGPSAIRMLESKGITSVFDPDRIKAVIDHTSPAVDHNSAVQGYILRKWCREQGIKDFFDIGRNGVCHALFPEKGFVRPGNTIIMGDSHTCTLGAFGAFACGVGTTALAIGFAKGIGFFTPPESICVNLRGKLPQGVYAKDVILYLLGRLGADGATNQVIEFAGDGISNLRMDERMTISNMTVEIGATCGIFPPDSITVDYLWPFICDEFSSPERALASYQKWTPDADASYSTILDIDLSELEPYTTYGFSPANVRPVREMAGTKVDQVYIGSCTNGRIEDLRVVAAIVKGQKLAEGVRGIISPATPEIFAKASLEGLIDIFLETGFCLTNPSCGACCGMSSGILAPGEVCVATTNRNFDGRMGKGGIIHLASPATAAWSGITGFLTNQGTNE